MALRIDGTHQVRWFLLAALGAAACGGTTANGGGTEGEPAGGRGGSRSVAGAGGSTAGVAGAVGGDGSAGHKAQSTCDTPTLDAGFETCSSGLVHRVKQVTCKNALSPMQPCGTLGRWAMRVRQEPTGASTATARSSSTVLLWRPVRSAFARRVLAPLVARPTTNAGRDRSATAAQRLATASQQPA
jgi:hypothetical protein